MNQFHRSIAAVFLTVGACGSASAAPEFTSEQICKAGIAALMGRSPSIMKTETSAAGTVYLYYTRKEDGSKWAYRCRVEGERIMWASDPGRWRRHADDEKVKYRVKGDNIEIIQVFTDGQTLKKRFTKAQLGK